MYEPYSPPKGKAVCNECSQYNPINWQIEYTITKPAWHQSAETCARPGCAPQNAHCFYNSGLLRLRHASVYVVSALPLALHVFDCAQRDRRKALAHWRRAM